MYAKRTRLCTDGLAHLMNQSRIKRCAKIEGTGKHCPADAADAVKRLPGENGGNTPAGMLDEVPLNAVESSRCGVHIMDKAHSVLAEILQQPFGIKTGVRLDGAAMPGTGTGGIFHTAHHAGLCGLFMQIHAGYQIRYAALDGKRSILILKHGNSSLIFINRYCYCTKRMAGFQPLVLRVAFLL